MESVLKLKTSLDLQHSWIPQLIPVNAQTPRKEH